MNYSLHQNLDLACTRSYLTITDPTENLLTDGSGENPDTQYYWKGPEGVLYHTEAEHEDLVNPFFQTIEDAERYLEQKEANSEELDENYFSGFKLYRVKQNGHWTELEAEEVLTEQAGLTEF